MISPHLHVIVHYQCRKMIFKKRFGTQSALIYVIKVWMYKN